MHPHAAAMSHSMTRFILCGCLLMLCFVSPLPVSAQSILDLKIEANHIGKNIAHVLDDFQSRSPGRIFFIDEWLNTILVDESLVGQTLRDGLTELFLGTDLSYIDVNANTLVIVRDPQQVLIRRNIITKAAREKKEITKLVIGNSGRSDKKMKTVTGLVKDRKSREILAGVSVSIADTGHGAISDALGRFSLSMLPGEYVLSFRAVNYEEKIIELSLYADGEVAIDLEETPMLLQEVVVEDKFAREITTSGIGQARISMKEIKHAPALLGEVDLIRQVQTLPGVTTVGEAASGYNVRGGSVDQNLILYDGIPIFNSSHVFGFFSAFNSEAIREVTFYRGGIPAEFGGRVSSVLDIRSREGSYEKWGINGGIGMVSTNLMINGPVVRDKSSLALSFRTTYSDWLINTIRSNYAGLNQSTVTFYDGSLKLAQLFGEKTKVTLSGYVSHDQFRLQGDSTFRWQSYMGSLRLDHEFTNQFHAAFTLGSGHYGYDVLDRNPYSGFQLTYAIAYPSAKADFHLTWEEHHINFGIQGTYYSFQPGTLSPLSETSIKKFVTMEKQHSIESGFYIADQIDIMKRWSADVGLRYSRFDIFGPGSVLQYAPNSPREPLNVVDTLLFKKNEKIKSYNNIEPRLGLRYNLKNESSLKLGYNRIYQYLHLVTNTTAVTPIDIWKPSDYYFKPQKADQISFGYFKNLKDKRYEFFSEIYFKAISNVLEFKDGAQLILNRQIETDLLQGKARMYGVETQISKLTGRITGSFGYAFSRSFRTITGRYEQERINNGREYPSNFDQPHVVNLSWKYSITKRHFFTGTFTYRTGRPITLPVYAFKIENYTVSAFSDRNQYRIPDYHRLDIGFVIEGNHKRKKLWDGTWTISVYNLYGRKNPYSVFFKEVQSGILRPYQLSIIGTVLPSVSYSFKI
jgi:hypothetical protein